jgi:hypothetical protein
MQLVGDDVGDRGDCIQIYFDPQEQNERAGARDPRVANGEEHKVGASPPCTPATLVYFRGGSIWTPPYCPNLQPIELFWAPKITRGVAFSSWSDNERNDESCKGGLVWQ